MLLLGKDSQLNDKTAPLKRKETRRERKSRLLAEKNGTYTKDTGVFGHLAMTQDGSQFGSEKHDQRIKEGIYDKDIRHYETTAPKSKEDGRLNLNVTNRNLKSVKLNPVLKKSLEEIFTNGRKVPLTDNDITLAMVDEINKTLKLPSRKPTSPP